MSKYFNFLAATVISLTFSAPVFANSDEVVVSYKDLNLGAAEDRAKLDRRLNGAAKDVCTVSGSYDIAAQVAARHCRTIALNDARQKAEVAVAQVQAGQQVASAK